MQTIISSADHANPFKVLARKIAAEQHAADIAKAERLRRSAPLRKNKTLSMPPVAR